METKHPISREQSHMKMGEIALSSWAIGICALSIILSVFVVPIL